MVGAAWSITAGQGGEPDRIGVTRPRLGGATANQGLVLRGIVSRRDAPGWQCGETRAGVCQGEPESAEHDHPRIDSHLFQLWLLATVDDAAFSADDGGCNERHGVARVHPVRDGLRIVPGRVTAAGDGLLRVRLGAKVQREKFLDGIFCHYDGSLGSLDTANPDRGLVAHDCLHAPTRVEVVS